MPGALAALSRHLRRICNVLNSESEFSGNLACRRGLGNRQRQLPSGAAPIPPSAVLEPFPPAARQRLVQRVYDAIFAEITEGRLQPGARLIQEDLAEAYGVSRQPVQQALLLLRQHGIIQDAARRGFVVPPLDVEHVRNLYQVRSALDGLASRMAAERGRARAGEGEPILAAGRAALAAGSIKGLIEADVAFHGFVSEISGNPIIVEMMRPNYTHMQRIMAEVLREDVSMPALIWSQHAAILHAIAAGDAAEAERLAVDHTEEAGRRFAKGLIALRDTVEADERARRLPR